VTRCRYLSTAWLIVAWGFGVAPLQAQTTEEGRFDAGVGFRFTGSMTLASANAVERGLGGMSRTVFSSETAIQPSAGALAWMSVRLTRLLDAEVAVTVSAPGLVTSITDDVENVPDASAREDIRQFSFEGGLVAHPAGWRRGPWRPFVDAGAGYLRQLHEGRVLVETGSQFYLGAGTRYLFKTPRPGIRADLRAAFFKDGIAFDSRYHGAPTFSLSAFVRF
jgi:hypothetical protein